ncbi:hypothetical protein [Nocardiopsis gilva]|nr:hypothetical protein [Nocardiopsis gilva]
MDVSAYLVNAATRQMAETEAAEAGFAGIDAVIADAMAQADHYGPADDTDVAALTEDEQRDVDDAMRLVYGQDEDAGRHRGDVA